MLLACCRSAADDAPVSNFTEKEETGDISGLHEQLDKSGPRFEVGISQNNVNIEIQNNEVTLERRDFNVVFHLSEPMGVLVNGSFSPEMFNNMEHLMYYYSAENKIVSDVDLNAFVHNRAMYLKPEMMLLSEVIFENWCYSNGGDHDFSGFEINAGGITTVRTIERFITKDAPWGETPETIRVSKASSPVYLVFLTKSKEENKDTEIILQRYRIKINWRDSNSHTAGPKAKVYERKMARNHNNEKFEVKIRQDGADIEIRNNEVTIENKEFDIVFNLSGPMGFIAKEGFDPEAYIVAERGGVLTDFLENGLASHGTGRYFERYLDRDNADIRLNTDDYWYYLNGDDHRFSKIEAAADSITAIRTVALVLRGRNPIFLSEVRNPLHMVFFSYVRGEDLKSISEIQRQYIKINWSPSAKTSAEVEALINNDKELSVLDKTVNELYATAHGMVNDQWKRDRLSREQRNWITYTRNSCLNKTCLNQTYRERIEILSRNDRDINDPNESVDSFNMTIRNENSGKILYCERLVNVSYRENAIYGGICISENNGKRTKVKICNASMTDAHKMEPVGPEEVTDEELEKFTDDNCSGG